MTEMLLDRSNITLNYNLLEDDIQKFRAFQFPFFISDVYSPWIQNIIKNVI